MPLCAAFAVVTDGVGDGHGQVKPGGLADPAEPSDPADPPDSADADGDTDWTCVDACGLVAPRLVDEFATPGLDVLDEPGWVGEVPLSVGAGLVDTGGTGLVDVGGAGLLEIGGAGLLEVGGVGLVLADGVLPIGWHVFAAGELADGTDEFAGAPEPVGSCDAPLDAGC